MNRLLLILGVVVLVGAGCFGGNKTEPVNPDDVSVPNAVQDENQEPTYTFPGQLSDDQIKGKRVRLRTEKGEIVFELFGDTAPLTSSNFVYLAGQGFYDGLIFHRREEGFVIQGGDPNGNGTGGPGYTFEDELEDEHGYERGTVAMANRGPNTNGSQFFIMLGDVPLPKAYSIFGRVTKGMDVVDNIQIGDKIKGVVVEDL